MDRRVPQRTFGVEQLSAPSVQYTEQTAEQCETFTDSEVLRIFETRNSRLASSNGSEGVWNLLKLGTTLGSPKVREKQKQARGINLWPAKILGRGGWI